MGRTTARTSSTSRLSASAAEVLLSECLMKAGAWDMREQLDAKALGCHMAVFLNLINCQAFGALNTIMERVFRQLLVCVYSLDTSTDLPPSIVAPGSMLARAPFFVVAQNLHEEVQRLQKHADHAKARAVDRDELRAQLDQAKADHSQAIQEVDALRNNLTMQTRTWQDQLVQAQTELSASQQELEFVKTEKDAEIVRLEGEAKQLEKQLLLVSDADISKFNEAENRLLQHGLAGNRSRTAQDHPTDNQQAAKLQQQLLGLLESHIQDLNAAYHQLASKPNSMEDVLSTFVSEADIIHLELQKLSPTVPAPAHALQGALAQDLSMCLPLEVESHLQGGHTSKGDMDPLWHQFWSHLPSDAVLPEEPQLISRERLCSFLNTVLWRYIERGIGVNSNSSPSSYLLEVLVRLYQDRLAATVVMHQVYSSLDSLRQGNGMIQLFCDILTDSIAMACWHYILMIHAVIHGQAGSFGRNDLSSLMHTVYPDTSTTKIQETVQRLRDSGHASNSFGVFLFLIHSIRSGGDVRLSRLQELIKARDIRAAGGLDKPEFLAFVAQHLPHVHKCDPLYLPPLKFNLVSAKGACRRNAEVKEVHCLHPTLQAGFSRLSFDTKC